MKSQYKIIDSLALRTDLSQIDSRARKGSATYVMSIFLLLIAQGFKVRFDGKGHYSGRIIGEVLLERSFVQFLEHVGKVWLWRSAERCEIELLSRDEVDALRGHVAG